MSAKLPDESNNVHMSYRSPTFSKLEVKKLINLVENYKDIILNKSINSTSNHAKDVAWVKIAKSFNEQGFEHTRSADSLKTKWENLKKIARKLSKNLIDADYNEYNILLSKVVSLMNEIEKSDNTEMSDTVPESSDSNIENQKEASEKYWDEDDKLSDQSMDGDGENVRLSRSLNFSPQECSLLLKCVRSEKKHIFAKENTGDAIKFKNNAWARITYSFNKLSSQKRTTKTLRTKFRNMKQLAKKFTTKTSSTYGRKKMDDETLKEINLEPSFECSADMEEDSNSDNGKESINNDNITEEEMPDPLSTVLNGDEGIDSSGHFGFGHQSNDQEVVKLKLELLKYQLETAKLERKRLLEATEAEKVERESRAIETSLRLRAARIALVTAEIQLPTEHPALGYHPDETMGQQYIESGSKDQCYENER